MADIITKQVDLGFDANIRDDTELPRGSAADGSQNVLYARSVAKTPYGFAKVDQTTTPLDSGNAVLGIGTFTELDKTQHFLAVTKAKIYDHDSVDSAWNDVTQSGVALGGNVFNPISFASVLHTDALLLNGTGDSWYHHSLVCTGTSAIQRWAGNREDDYADLLGADGYHAVGSGYTTHIALQVGTFFNRILLVSAKEADANGVLHDNNQRVRYPTTGTAETWTGTGSGYYDLLDTGGHNIWGSLLGTQWIQYQNNSIWSLSHVGGTRILAPDIEIPDLGLLAPRLLYSKNNVHYFVGNDYNVYAYFGGSNIQKISKGIDRYLRRDLDPAYASRGWLVMGAEKSRLWLFIVPNGQVYATMAYAIDQTTGKWMKRDFTHKWTDSLSGITSVTLVGASSYFAGESYDEILAQTARAPIAVEIGEAARSSNVVTVTHTHEFLAADVVTIAGCTGATNNFNGTFTITGVSTTVSFTYAQTGANEANTTAGTATVATSYRDAVAAATTYRQQLQETLVAERIALGDSAGFVYQYDSDLTTDDTIAIPSRHLTEVYDLGIPHHMKIFPGIRITAKGTSIVVSYRTGSFETVGDGWTDFDEQALTSEFVDYEFFINDTAKKIQFKFSNIPDSDDPTEADDGDDWMVSNYTLVEPQVEGSI